MSHISRITGVKITDLSLLAEACEKLGLYLNQTKKTYSSSWTDELDCVAVVQSSNGGEAAIVKTDEGYEIQWDSYSNPLRNIIGSKCEKLLQGYSEQAVLQQVNFIGMVNSVERTEDDCIVIKGCFL